MAYAITTEITGAEFDQVEKSVREILAENGFGILTEIDVKATMKEKLDINRKPYKILGACNPPRANQALTGEPDIGVMLPCNVIVYETEEGNIRVGATNAKEMFSIVGNDEVLPVANEVNDIMEKFIDELNQQYSK